MLMRALFPSAVLFALALAACGEGNPSPPAKRVSMDDIASAAARLFEKPKPKPAPQLPQHQPDPQPSLAFVPLPRPAPVVAAMVRQPPPTAAKPKPKPQAPKQKTKPAPAKGIGGYSCATVRLAGSAAAVERMAIARGHVVTASTRRQIQACFNQR